MSVFGWKRWGSRIHEYSHSREAWPDVGERGAERPAPAVDLVAGDTARARKTSPPFSVSAFEKSTGVENQLAERLQQESGERLDITLRQAEVPIRDLGR